MCTLNNPIVKIQAYHNCAAASKHDFTEANGLQASLYLAKGAEVMLMSNLWSEVGLHNGAKGKVVDIVYTTANGPRDGNLPEAVVVQFDDLSNDVDSFLSDMPCSVAFPVQTVEWKNPSKLNQDFICKQFPLVLSWAFTIHKSQCKTLHRVVIDLGKSEKCCGMTLVALSRVQRLKDVLIKPFIFERLQKVNQSDQSQSIQLAISELRLKAESIRLRYIKL